MKFTKLSLLVLLFLISYSYSQKLVSSSFVATVGGGISLPMAESDFTDSYNMGLNFHVSGGYKLNNSFIVRADAQYNRFTYKSSSGSNVSGGFTVITGKIDLLAGNFNKKTKFHPYALAGTGSYFLSADVTDGIITISESETDFGAGFGAGFIVDVSKKAGIYVESQYNFIFNDGTAKGYLPIKVGVFVTP